MKRQHTGSNGAPILPGTRVRIPPLRLVGIQAWKALFIGYPQNKSGNKNCGDAADCHKTAFRNVAQW